MPDIHFQPTTNEPWLAVRDRRHDVCLTLVKGFFREKFYELVSALFALGGTLQAPSLGSPRPSTHDEERCCLPDIPRPEAGSGAIT